MSRNVRAAAVALALAGGVYLAGAPAQASNMGFKLERSFDLLRNSSTSRPLQNHYWVSFPLFNGLGDTANVADPANDKCVGDAGGPGAGDGLYTATDAICDMWTARSNPATAGTFTFSYIKREECSLYSRNGTVSLGAIRFTGPDFPLLADIGYDVFITVPGAAAYSPQNRAVIVGSHDPSFAGRQIVAAPTCTGGQTTNCCGANAPRTDLINLPYHTMYKTSDEILCGLEGVDWTDANLDGRPDRCWNDQGTLGTFDAGDTTTGVFDGRVAMTVSTFKNDETTNGAVARTATIQIGSLRFTGTEFDLIPGDAYLLNISKTHTPTTWLSPHY
jgi:hypothetical protein